MTRAQASKKGQPISSRPWSYVWESLEADWNAPFKDPAGQESPRRIIVALGKFDAMHKGHRLLALTAAKMGGEPWMLSFAGMGEVLGWPERKPLVAPCDRPRVLESWAAHCQAHSGDPSQPVVPQQRYIPFAEIRGLSPEEFVRLLADMKVDGIVAGVNYRFGFKAAGDADMLVDLGTRYGLEVRIVELLESGDFSKGEDTQVSSSQIRAALQVLFALLT